ncbi:winged helix-turn-helix domain-containing protein [Edaphobacter aggregans]|uniref:winged helix-turn-helix domain-containing protein n=1 Tax=Edaphobacter aggregans TaxID=570835 RepID=UPI000551E059|nr:winged helix-turn-helix domain-containing protein [Edaphobacter aggregans]
MAPEKAVPQELVLDLTSFQLIRAGRRVKLEKTPMELLTLLVRRQGALVTREEIVCTVWGDAVHIDVDAGINTAIRKIRQALEDNSASPRYLETVIGKGYRFTGAITVVENHDALPAQTASAPREQPGNRSKAVLAVVGLVAVLLLTLFVIHRGTPPASGKNQGHLIIAVAPLQNLSEDPGQDYFADGLTDEILTQLGQLNPERLSVVRYRPSATMPQSMSAIADFGQRSDLQYLLEGSVRHYVDQKRISIRLVRMADGATLWTDSFDRQLGDVLSVQSEIAQRIGRKLQIQVLGRANRKSANPEVVEAYLRGRFEMSRRYELRPPAPYDTARTFFERATMLDPSYAPAHAGLADFYRQRALRDDEGDEEAWRMAEQHAMQALSLDDQAAENHAAIAQIKLTHDWDWRAAREHALRALQLNPSSPEAHAVYARYLRFAGNTGEALNHSKQALALDPFRVDLRWDLTNEYYIARDYKGAATSARQLLPYDPFSAHGFLCFDLGSLKLFNESVAECSQMLALDGHSDWVSAYLREYRRKGYEAAMSFMARKYLGEILKRPQPDLWELANVYVLAGMREEALHTLFQGLKIHQPGLLQVRVDPDFDSIRNEPRYAELVRQIGFPTE